MNKLAEIFNLMELELDGYTNQTCIHRNDLEALCKDYAEWYAKECLRLASEQMKATNLCEYDTKGQLCINTVMDKNLVLNITLPNHE